MTLTRDSVYVAQYEARQRDPIVDYVNRASVANGRMSKWQRFNKGPLEWIETPEGMRAITPTQNRVWALLRSLMDEGDGTKRMLTMREMAAELSVSASTVSRAITKFVSWGLLTAIIGRGRFAGVALFKYVKDGGFLDWKRSQAKARIRRWYEAAQRRISRLEFNVAPYLIEGDEGGIYYLNRGHITTSTKGATLTAQLPWTVDELREAGII